MTHNAVDYAELLPLLDELLNRPEADRAAWLARLPEAHAAWRPYLERMMRANERLGALSRVPNFVSAAISDAASLLHFEELSPGERIGPYELIRELGRGGMGRVWLANRADGAFNRAVALKLPLVDWAARLGEHMQRERDILAALEHPNIARFYDAGTDGQGRRFMAMEYVEGRPIDVYCREQRLSIRSRLLLVLKVAKAVAFAHSKLVVHQDLKPSNILVTADGDVRLLDFGIAKLIGAEPAEAGARGQLLTPRYASPEQRQGDAIGTATDVYSLGIVAYELLTETRAHEDNVNRTGEPRAASKSAMDPSRTRQLRDDLDAILKMATQDHPGQRYAALATFAADIERYLDGLPVHAREATFVYRARKFIVRNRVPVAAATIVISSIFAGAALALWQANQARIQATRALASASRAEAVTTFLKYLISDAAESDKPVTVSDMLARSEALITSENRGNPDHQAAVLDMLGDEYHTQGEDGKAESLLSQALQILQDSRDPSLRAIVACDHAAALAGSGRRIEAENALHAVIDSGAADSKGAATCFEVLAWIAQDTFDMPGALKWSQQALEQLRQTPNHSLNQEAEFIGTLAGSLSLNDRVREADQYFEESLRRYKELGRDGSADAIELLNDWGIAIEAQGNPRQALGIYDRALSSLAARDPNARPPVYLVANRAHALEYMGRYVDAMAGNKSCAELAKHSGSAPGEEVCLCGQTFVALDLGDLPAAEQYFSEAVELRDRLSLSGGAGASNLDSATAMIALSHHQLEKARAAFEAVIALTFKGVPPPAMALLGRAQVSLEEHRLAEAMQDANQALAISQKRQGDKRHSNRTGLAWYMIAKIRENQGDHVGAKKAAGEAVRQFSDTVDPSLREAEAAARMAGG